MKLIAKTLLGLENILGEEIKAIGGQNIEVLNRAVSFEGEMDMVYKANLYLRTAISILTPIYSFHAKHENHFYKKIKDFNWEDIMGLKDTFVIKSTVNSEFFTHSHYISLKAKDAIVDQFYEKYDKRPDVNKYAPTYVIQLHITGSKCTVLLDSSGDSLYKRGYRMQAVDAPINEALAAGMILLSGWDKKSTFIDPMCGSGTLPIEAAMIAKNIPPQINRESFAFKNWKQYKEKDWLSVKEEAIKNIKEVDVDIYGYDKEMGAVRKADINANGIPQIEGLIKFQRKAFEKLQKPNDEGILIFNPPYDERMKLSEVDDFYAHLGDQLKNNFTGYQAWIISSNADAIKSIGLRTSKRIVLYNGKLECRFLNYDLYKGSKKTKYKNVSEA